MTGMCLEVEVEVVPPGALVCCVCVGACVGVDWVDVSGWERDGCVALGGWVLPGGCVAGVLCVGESACAARTPSDSATTTASVTIGPFQFGAGASRVRAAAPQLKHHSWWACSGLPHSGQASPGGAGEGTFAGAS